MGDFIPDVTSDNPFQATEGHLLREQLKTVLGTLSDREREVVVYRFGLRDGAGCACSGNILRHAADRQTRSPRRFDIIGAWLAD